MFNYNYFNETFLIITAGSFLSGSESKETSSQINPFLFSKTAPCCHLVSGSISFLTASAILMWIHLQAEAYHWPRGRS